MQRLCCIYLALVAILATVPQAVFGIGQINTFRQLSCNVNVPEADTYSTTSVMSCCRSCREDTECTVAHFNKETSSCLTDTLLTDALVENPNPNNSWISFIRHERPCASNWLQFQESCYNVSSALYVWSDCISYCQNRSSYPATIRSDNENEFVHGIVDVLPLNDKFMYIGAERKSNYEWDWINGEPWDYTNWHVGEPNHFTEHSVAMFPRSTNLKGWADIGSDYLAYCLCEKSATASIPTTCLN